MASDEPKKLVVLISNGVSDRIQASNQGRALTLLKAKRTPCIYVDGMDPEQREKRNELFAISGIRANYPQFFFESIEGVTTYLGNWEYIEGINENSTLPADILEAHPHIETWPKMFGNCIDETADMDEELYHESEELYDESEELYDESEQTGGEGLYDESEARTNQSYDSEDIDDSVEIHNQSSGESESETDDEDYEDEPEPDITLSFDDDDDETTDDNGSALEYADPVDEEPEPDIEIETSDDDDDDLTEPEVVVGVESDEEEPSECSESQQELAHGDEVVETSNGETIEAIEEPCDPIVDIERNGEEIDDSEELDESVNNESRSLGVDVSQVHDAAQPVVEDGQVVVEEPDSLAEESPEVTTKECQQETEEEPIVSEAEHVTVEAESVTREFEQLDGNDEPAIVEATVASDHAECDPLVDERGLDESEHVTEEAESHIENDEADLVSDEAEQEESVEVGPDGLVDDSIAREPQPKLSCEKESTVAEPAYGSCSSIAVEIGSGEPAYAAGEPVSEGAPGQADAQSTEELESDEPPNDVAGPVSEGVSEQTDHAEMAEDPTTDESASEPVSEVALEQATHTETVEELAFDEPTAAVGEPISEGAPEQVARADKAEELDIDGRSNDASEPVSESAGLAEHAAVQELAASDEQIQAAEPESDVPIPKELGFAEAANEEPKSHAVTEETEQDATSESEPDVQVDESLAACPPDAQAALPAPIAGACLDPAQSESCTLVAEEVVPAPTSVEGPIPQQRDLEQDQTDPKCRFR